MLCSLAWAHPAPTCTPKPCVFTKIQEALGKQGSWWWVPGMSTRSSFLTACLAGEDTWSEPSAHREPSSIPGYVQCAPPRPPNSGGCSNAEQMVVSAPRRGSEKQIDLRTVLMQISKL